MLAQNPRLWYLKTCSSHQSNLQGRGLQPRLLPRFAGERVANELQASRWCYTCAVNSWSPLRDPSAIDVKGTGRGRRSCDDSYMPSCFHLAQGLHSFLPALFQHITNSAQHAEGECSVPAASELNLPQRGLQVDASRQDVTDVFWFAWLRLLIFNCATYLATAEQTYIRAIVNAFKDPTGTSPWTNAGYKSFCCFGRACSFACRQRSVSQWLASDDRHGARFLERSTYGQQLGLNLCAGNEWREHMASLLGEEMVNPYDKAVR